VKCSTSTVWNTTSNICGADSSVATRRGNNWHASRGLKPTAKFTPSLRDEDNSHAASNQALKRTLEFIDSILGGETK
jgi:hypothetical protein